MIDIQNLLKTYCAWICNQTSITPVEGTPWMEVTVPYLDRHNDYIQFYLSIKNETIHLSDQGDTLSDLLLSGCDFSSPIRKRILTVILNGFGVEQHDDVLQTTATDDDFPIKFHNFIQSLLAVNDLFYLAKPIVQSVFKEDVAAWLNSLGIRYTPDIIIEGASGYKQTFDFVIPFSDKAPERFLQTISKPTRSSIDALIFHWIDTHKTRKPDSQLFALLDDQEKSPQPKMTDAMKEYGIQAYNWSGRDSLATVLSC